MTPVLDAVLKAHALISDKSKWTTHALARTAEGKITWPRGKEVPVCFCSAGALLMVSKSNGQYGELVGEFMGVLGAHYSCLSAFNDTSTHEEVLRVWDKVIAKLEKEQR